MTVQRVSQFQIIYMQIFVPFNLLQFILFWLQFTMKLKVFINQMTNQQPLSIMMIEMWFSLGLLDANLSPCINANIIFLFGVSDVHSAL